MIKLCECNRCDGLGYIEDNITLNQEECDWCKGIGYTDNGYEIRDSFVLRIIDDCRDFDGAVDVDKFYDMCREQNIS